MKKQFLDLDVQLDFDLIAMVTPVRDYRLCWQFNLVFHTDLYRTNDLRLKTGKSKKAAYFSRFEYTDPLNKSHFYLLSNKSMGEFLLPELKNFDYLFMMQGDYVSGKMEAFLQKIKTLPEMQTAFTVQTEQLQSKTNLLF